MSEFVSNPLFGIALSILAYLGGMMIFRRYPHPLTTPLLNHVFILLLEERNVKKNDCARKFFEKYVRPTSLILLLSFLRQLFVNKPR